MLTIQVFTADTSDTIDEFDGANDLDFYPAMGDGDDAFLQFSATLAKDMPAGSHMVFRISDAQLAALVKFRDLQRC